MSSRLLDRLPGWLAPAAAPPRPVHAAPAFRALLRRERARAGDAGHELSLLVLLPAPRHRRRVAGFLGRRLRETDAVGWMDDGRVAALLADTGRAGAETVAAQVLAALAAGGAGLLGHAVHSYPGDWSAAEGDGEPAFAAPPLPGNRPCALQRPATDRYSETSRGASPSTLTHFISRG